MQDWDDDYEEEEVEDEEEENKEVEVEERNDDDEGQGARPESAGWDTIGESAEVLEGEQHPNWPPID